MVEYSLLLFGVDLRCGGHQNDRPDGRVRRRKCD
jgi:hypothetical protein